MMRLDLGFARPLGRDAQTRLLLALAALAKVQSVRFTQGDHHAVVLGEALGRQTVLDALAAEGVVPERITTSLDEAGDAAADEDPEARKERVRAIGR